MTTLGFERGSSATTGHRRFQRELDQIIAEGPKNGKASDPLIRQRLATAWTKVKIMEINGYRSLTDALNGTHHMAALGRLQQDVLVRVPPGRDGAGPRHPGHGRPDPDRRPRRRVDVRLKRGRDDYPVSDLQASFFFSGRRPSGEGRRRSSATSWASGCWACPRSPSRPPPRPDDRGGRPQGLAALVAVGMAGSDAVGTVAAVGASTHLVARSTAVVP